jgi:hypothetical protein
MLCVFGGDGLVLARSPDGCRAAAALDAGLLLSAALFSLEWGAALQAAPAVCSLSLASVLDALSVAAVLAELSWLSSGLSPALACAARAARMLRFGRLSWQAAGVLRRLRRAVRRRAAKADGGGVEAPSAIAAAICEEVVNKVRSQRTARTAEQRGLWFDRPCSSRWCSS